MPGFLLVSCILGLDLPVICNGLLGVCVNAVEMILCFPLTVRDVLFGASLVVASGGKHHDQLSKFILLTLGFANAEMVLK